ncbi:nuclear fragile X mental retardation-interacting protein 1-like isoform X2 [Anneissia japonica]|uniref:nuclear fragile X mental retardation-interacting protein 1-like isoform X2 n=1 Tax=Anneissia japonica TaxID=1529436 RepID=UPI0014258A84|nr:nuclear fragile X mental retardation-interacting protein 1-like isoform X2 [Anneissia japonica]
MAYSFPPRGFSVFQNNVSAAEKCDEGNASVPENPQCSSGNGEITHQLNDNQYFGYPPPRVVGPWSRPPHPHPFPNNFRGKRMLGPRPRHCFPPFSRDPFHRQNFDNNWPRPYVHEGPPHLHGIEQFQNNGYPNSSFQMRHPNRKNHLRNNNVNKTGPNFGQSAKKRKLNAHTHQGNWSDNEAVINKFDFFCDMCDRGFKSDETYQEHLRSHVKCDVKGCKFEGAFKIVKQHKKMQHASNSKPIGSLETPEEVEKWRQERRKKYPTISNVQKKEAEVKERIRSGNVLKTKEFGKMKHKPETLESDQQKKTQKVEESQRDASCLGSLGSLMAAYGESDSEKNNSSEEEGEIRMECQPVRQTMDDPNVQTMNDPGVKKLNWKEKRKLRRKEIKLSKKNKKVEHSNKRRNLLEMLLAPDIRHERNVILQCVRFIVSQKFFDKSVATMNGGVENLESSVYNQVVFNSKEVAEQDEETH